MPSAPCPSLASPAALRHDAAPVRRLSFAQLSAGAREVRIEHAGQDNRLSLTAQNKLILTK
ncbi:MAG: hemin uptake protein HemP [Serpentinimonas sp.]|nr:hemin uptake protein HemP [Serpentinimonas sp.]